MYLIKRRKANSIDVFVFITFYLPY